MYWTWWRPSWRAVASLMMFAKSNGGGFNHLQSCGNWAHLSGTSPSPMETASGVPKKNRWPVAMGCLTAWGLVVLLAGVTYLLIRSPHFHDSAVVSIELVMRSPDSPPGAPVVAVQATVTDERGCRSLFEFLRSARVGLDHKCEALGVLTMQYADGRSDTLDVLPGHDLAKYEFRFGGRMYRMPREPFFEVLRSAGIDSARMPESEH